MARRSDRTKRLTRADALAGVASYPKARADERRFGKPTVFYNAGHFKGYDEGVTKAKERALPAIDLLIKRTYFLSGKIRGKKIPPMTDTERRSVAYLRSFFERAEHAAKRNGLRPAKKSAGKKVKKSGGSKRAKK